MEKCMGGIIMGTESIYDFLRIKEDLISSAESYMWELENNPVHRAGGKILEIDYKSDGEYEIVSTFNGQAVEIAIPREKIWKLVWKSEDEDELKKRIDAYIRKKIYKQSMKMYKEQRNL